MSGAGLVFRGVVMRLTDVLVAEVGHTVPVERLAFTDSDCLFEIVRLEVLHQDQSPQLATAGRRAVALELIGARSGEGVGLLYATVHIRPGVTMLTSEACIGLVNLLRMFLNMQTDQRVASQIIGELTAIGVRLAVVDDCFVVADGEVLIYLHQFHYGQVQTVVVVITVSLLLCGVVITGLAGMNAVPDQGSTRADGSGGVNRVHFVDRQFQHIDTIATKAVHSVIEVRTCLR